MPYLRSWPRGTVPSATASTVSPTDTWPSATPRSRPLRRPSSSPCSSGNGCSAAAIRDGRSVDTSMGLTPLEGLMMGTRSGDGPSLAAYLARRESVEVAEVVTWLNKRSGLLGLSGTSRDMRELLAARNRGDGRAAPRSRCSATG